MLLLVRSEAKSKVLLFFCLFRIVATHLLLPYYWVLFAISVSGDARQSQSATNPSKRVYTVLPPPADYVMHSKGSFTILHIEHINSAKDPAGKSTIILSLWSCAAHHKAGRDLQHMAFSWWLSEVLKSFFLIVSVTLFKANTQRYPVCSWTERNLNAAQMVFEPQVILISF